MGPSVSRYPLYMVFSVQPSGHYTIFNICLAAVVSGCKKDGAVLKVSNLHDLRVNRRAFLQKLIN